MTHKPDLYMIGGPTASGKTAKALELAAAHHGHVINADAMQVYAGLPLLTAQPSAEERKAAPHSLFEVFDPSETSSAGRWLELARAAIEAARISGHVPIVVGGTGLYFAALLGRLAAIPPIPATVHAQLAAQYEAQGHDAFRAALAKLDPQSAATIKPNDRQRLIRAYEVAAHTGSPLSVWQEKGAATSIEATHNVHKICLMPERAALYARCDKRFLHMMAAGALDEVRALFARKLDPALPAMKILGVPSLMMHLRGVLSLEEAIAKAQQSTRHYAKRQMTWFRHQW